MALRDASIGARLIGSCVGVGLALLFGFGAAHWYVQPRVVGSPPVSVWAERDFLCSMASSAVAVGVGVASGRAATGAGALAARSLVARVLIWAVLTLLFVALWVDHVFLFTLLIAPAHAFACLRVIGLWSRWRSEVAWRSPRS